MKNTLKISGQCDEFLNRIRALTPGVFAWDTTGVVITNLLKTMAREFSVLIAKTGWHVKSCRSDGAIGSPLPGAFTVRITGKAREGSFDP